ncbi:hypothetical protein ACFCZT_30305 [Streptomyces sp. NPDC056230]|uniref:hypothetical protein n=1 Tax=unclassified Streptomyces TaxID=2593676 RepID=UPI0035E38A49
MTGTTIRSTTSASSVGIRGSMAASSAALGVAGLDRPEVVEGADHRVRGHRGERRVGVLEHGGLVNERWERDRHWHSSDRISVEHALADHKRWKQLTRWTHRRDRLPDTCRAIVGLVPGAAPPTVEPQPLNDAAHPHPPSRTNSLVVT